mgnify:CR=1 FL=1
MLHVKPIGRGFRKVTVLEIRGGHMDRALTFTVGAVFEFLGIRWRILEVRAQ